MRTISLLVVSSCTVSQFRRNSHVYFLDIFWILGLSLVIKPLPFQPELNLDLWATVGSSALLFVWMFLGKRHMLERWQGVAFILLYVTYVVAIVMRG